jgi:hypothetical protein
LEHLFPHQTVLVKEGFWVYLFTPRNGHSIPRPKSVIFDPLFMLHDDRFDVRAREMISVLDGFWTQTDRGGVVLEPF